MAGAPQWMLLGAAALTSPSPRALPEEREEWLVPTLQWHYVLNERGHTQHCVRRQNTEYLHQQCVCLFLLVFLICKSIIPWQPRLPHFRALKCCHNIVSILCQPSQSSKKKEKWNYRVTVILFQLMISYNSLFVTKLISFSWTLFSH